DEPIVRALAPDPAQRFATARELVEALRTIIQPAANATEQDVIALYVEGGPGELALAATFAATTGMTIAMTAPDSLIAVAPTHELCIAESRGRLEEIARGAKVAVGTSRATICGGVVDGPALDVEGWAPYPLAGGLWITPSLL